MGIRATLSRLSELLRRADEPLWEHLVEKNKVRWALILCCAACQPGTALDFCPPLRSTALVTQHLMRVICCQHDVSCMHSATSMALHALALQD